MRGQFLYSIAAQQLGLLYKVLWPESKTLALGNAIGDLPNWV
jgi:hypothetical protein